MEYGKMMYCLWDSKDIQMVYTLDHSAKICYLAAKVYSNMTLKVTFTKVIGKMGFKTAGALLKMKQVHLLVFGSKARSRRELLSMIMARCLLERS